MKNKIIIYMILMVGLFFSCLENKYEQYSTLETLNEKEIRWIPFFLVENPNIKKQVFDIYERHDLDTNESWGKFSVIDNDYILGQTENIQQMYPLNLQKIKNNLTKIGYSNIDYSKGVYIKNEKSVYILFFDEDKKIYYYFGKLGI